MATPTPHARGILGGLRRYLLVAGGIIAVFLASFLVVEYAGVPVLTDPQPLVGTAGPLAAAAGVGLLVADVVLPVPSSLVMVGHGTLFGVVVGALLSLAGSVGMAAVAFAIGRRGGGLLERVVPAAERHRADTLLDRWGPLALVVSRPMPMLAETVAILAGASPLGWARAMLAATVGAVPPAFVFAVTGSVAASFASTAVVFTLVLAAAVVICLVERRGAARRHPRAVGPAVSTK